MLKHFKITGYLKHYIVWYFALIFCYARYTVDFNDFSLEICSLGMLCRPHSPRVRLFTFVSPNSILQRMLCKLNGNIHEKKGYAWFDSGKCFCPQIFNNSSKIKML